MKSDDHEVTRDEAGQILTTAGAIAAEREGKIKVRDLKEAGAEVGLTGESIDAALERQALEQVQADRRRLRRQTWVFRGVTALCVTLIASTAVSIWNGNTLGNDGRAIELHRSHVREAMVRQQGMRALMADQPPSSTREAELVGAQNRVSVAMRRYDAAVATYNADSDCWMPFRSYRVYPQRYPFSQEVSRW